jgi:hypothetical protein
MGPLTGPQLQASPFVQHVQLYEVGIRGQAAVTCMSDVWFGVEVYQLDVLCGPSQMQLHWVAFAVQT